MHDVAEPGRVRGPERHVAQQVLIQLIRLEHPHRQVETGIGDQRVRVAIRVGAVVGVDGLCHAPQTSNSICRSDDRRANLVEAAEIVEAAGEHAGRVRRGRLRPNQPITS